MKNFLRERKERKRSTNLRPGHRAQTGLRLFGEAGEDHGDVISGVLVSGAGNDDSVAVQFARALRRLQGESHFGPG